MTKGTRIGLAAAMLALSACGAPVSGQWHAEQVQAHAVPQITPTLTLQVSQVPPQPVPGAAPMIEYDLRKPVQPAVQVAASSRPTQEEEPAETSQPPAEGQAVPAMFTPGEFLGKPFEPGTFDQRTWYAGETFYGSAIPTPVLVATGRNPGQTLCLTAAVHGDELNGIETVRRVMHQLDVEKLTGTVIGVPIVNLQGFQRHSRYLPDRRDLNRFFPGNTEGSSASRMAYSFFHEVIMHCDGLVDLHTGSFHRTNLPQLRADLHNPDVVALTEGFGSTVILHSGGAEGTLRHAAVAAGIPAVTLEAGEPMRVHNEHVEHSVKGIFTLLDTLGMYNRRSLWGNPEPVYYTATWLRSDVGGILSSQARLGRRVKAGDLLGTVTDPITNEVSEVRSPHDGRIIGMALDQFVMPGFAVYHVGLQAPMEAVTEDDPDAPVDHSLAQVDNPEEH